MTISEQNEVYFDRSVRCFGFLFFCSKQMLFRKEVSKLLLDSEHDAMPYYQYCKRENITPFIDLNGKGGRSPVYKNDFSIDSDGVPICQAGCRMRRDATEATKSRTKFKCPKISRKNGCISCTCIRMHGICHLNIEKAD